MAEQGFVFNGTIRVDTDNSLQVTVKKIQDKLNGITLMLDTQTATQKLDAIIMKAGELQGALDKIGSAKSQVSSQSPIAKVTKNIEKDVQAMQYSFGKAEQAIERYRRLFKKEPLTRISKLRDAYGKVYGFEEGLTRFEERRLRSRNRIPGYNQSAYQVGTSMRNFAGFAIGATVVYKFNQLLREGVQSVLAFDDQLTKLSQIANSTVKEVEGIGKAVSDLSTNLGVSSSELLKSSNTLLQAGYTIEQTKALLSAIAKTDLSPTFDSIEKTTEGVIALLSQFQIAGKQLSVSQLEKNVTETLSSISAVSKAFAIESGDIIEAIKRSGGAFAVASGDAEEYAQSVTFAKDKIAEFVALNTAVRATTRETIATVATGLRSVFARIQVPGRAEQLRKLLGVDIVEDGKFLGPFEAFKRISKVLSEISSKSEKYREAIEIIAGNRQQRNVIPIIENFDTVAMKAYGVYRSGANQLDEDAAKAQDRLSIAIKKTKEEFLELFRSVAKSTEFKALIKDALSLASAFTRVVESIKPIIPLLGVFYTTKLLTTVPSLLVGAAGRGNLASPLRRNTGGPIPGYSKVDNIPLLASGGEYMINARAAKEIGRPALDYMNKAGSLPGFAKGSIKPFASKEAHSRLGEYTDIFDNVFGFDARKTLRRIELLQPQGLLRPTAFYHPLTKTVKIEKNPSEAAFAHDYMHELTHALDNSLGHRFDSGLSFGLFGSSNKSQISHRKELKRIINRFRKYTNEIAKHEYKMYDFKGNNISFKEMLEYRNQPNELFADLGANSIVRHPSGVVVPGTSEFVNIIREFTSGKASYIPDFMHGGPFDTLKQLFNFAGSKRAKRLGKGGHGEVFVHPDDNSKVVKFLTKDAQSALRTSSFDEVLRYHSVDNPFGRMNFGQPLQEITADGLVVAQIANRVRGRTIPQINKVGGNEAVLEVVDRLLPEIVEDYIQKLIFIQSKGYTLDPLNPGNLLFQRRAGKPVAINPIDLGVQGSEAHYRRDAMRAGLMLYKDNTLGRQIPDLSLHIALMKKLGIKDGDDLMRLYNTNFQGFATGGRKYNARVMPGEVILSPSQARSVGYDTLNQYNFSGTVPGTGNQDSVLAHLAEGSYVLNKKASKRIRGFDKGGAKGAYGDKELSLGYTYREMLEEDAIAMQEELKKRLQANNKARRAAKGLAAQDEKAERQKEADRKRQERSSSRPARRETRPDFTKRLFHKIGTKTPGYEFLEQSKLSGGLEETIKSVRKALQDFGEEKGRSPETIKQVGDDFEEYIRRQEKDFGIKLRTYDYPEQTLREAKAPIHPNAGKIAGFSTGEGTIFGSEGYIRKTGERGLLGLLSHEGVHEVGADKQDFGKIPGVGKYGQKYVSAVTSKTISQLSPEIYGNAGALGREEGALFGGRNIDQLVGGDVKKALKLQDTIIAEYGRGEKALKQFVEGLNQAIIIDKHNEQQRKKGRDTLQHPGTKKSEKARATVSKFVDETRLEDSRAALEKEKLDYHTRQAKQEDAKIDKLIRQESNLTSKTSGFGLRGKRIGYSQSGILGKLFSSKYDLPDDIEPLVDQTGAKTLKNRDGTRTEKDNSNLGRMRRRMRLAGRGFRRGVGGYSDFVGRNAGAIQGVGFAAALGGELLTGPDGPDGPSGLKAGINTGLIAGTTLAGIPGLSVAGPVAGIGIGALVGRKAGFTQQANKEYRLAQGRLEGAQNTYQGIFDRIQSGTGSFSTDYARESLGKMQAARGGARTAEIYKEAQEGRGLFDVGGSLGFSDERREAIKRAGDNDIAAERLRVLNETINDSPDLAWDFGGDSAEAIFKAAIDQKSPEEAARLDEEERKIRADKSLTVKERAAKISQLRGEVNKAGVRGDLFGANNASEVNARINADEFRLLAREKFQEEFAPRVSTFANEERTSAEQLANVAQAKILKDKTITTKEAARNRISGEVGLDTLTSGAVAKAYQEGINTSTRSDIDALVAQKLFDDPTKSKSKALEEAFIQTGAAFDIKDEKGNLVFGDQKKKLDALAAARTGATADETANYQKEVAKVNSEIMGDLIEQFEDTLAGPELRAIFENAQNAMESLLNSFKKAGEAAAFASDKIDYNSDKVLQRVSNRDNPQLRLENDQDLIRLNNYSALNQADRDQLFANVGGSGAFGQAAATSLNYTAQVQEALEAGAAGNAGFSVDDAQKIVSDLGVKGNVDNRIIEKIKAQLDDQYGADKEADFVGDLKAGAVNFDDVDAPILQALQQKAALQSSQLQRVNQYTGLIQDQYSGVRSLRESKNATVRGFGAGTQDLVGSGATLQERLNRINTGITNPLSTGTAPIDAASIIGNRSANRQALQNLNAKIEGDIASGKGAQSTDLELFARLSDEVNAYTASLEKLSTSTEAYNAILTEAASINARGEEYGNYIDDVASGKISRRELRQDKEALTKINAGDLSGAGTKRGYERYRRAVGRNILNPREQKEQLDALRQAGAAKYGLGTPEIEDIEGNKVNVNLADLQSGDFARTEAERLGNKVRSEQELAAGAIEKDKRQNVDDIRAANDNANLDFAEGLKSIEAAFTGLKDGLPAFSASIDMFTAAVNQLQNTKIGVDVGNVNVALTFNNSEGLGDRIGGPIADMVAERVSVLIEDRIHKLVNEGQV